MSTPCFPLCYPYAIQAKPYTPLIQAPKDQSKVSRRSKAVKCLETGVIFPSREQAAQWAGCTGPTINKAVCTGAKANGYHWVNT